MSTNAGQQQVAIVTGASSGLGLGITRALLQRGFRVVANSRTISKSKELKPSADLVLVDGDIGIKETASKVAEAAVSHFGPVPRPFGLYTRLQACATWSNDEFAHTRSAFATHIV